MNVIWGLIIAAVGALFITWGHTKSDFGLYRLLVARSRILWATESTASTKSPSGQRTRVARTLGRS
jgi:hypothetical protein